MTRQASLTGVPTFAGARSSQLPEDMGPGAAWGDFDNDRDLDLYVTGYVRYVEDANAREQVSRQYGHAVPYTLNPVSFEPERNLLFENAGDGTFTEVAEELGVANPEGRSLGALWHDFDADGRLDLVVANGSTFESKDDPTRLEPQVPQLLWNPRGEHFHDLAPLAEVLSVPHVGRGLAVSDYDLDGDPDLLFVHQGEGVQLLRNDMATGRSLQLRLVSRTADGELRGFGDGATVVARLRATEETGLRACEEIAGRSEGVGTAARSAVVGAPLARRADAGVAGPTSRRHNEARGDSGAPAVGPEISSQALNAPEGGPRPAGPRGVAGTADPADGETLILRRTVGGASYLSQSSRTLHLGLGEADRVEELEVHWLGGGTDVHRDLEAGAVWELREGDPAPRRLHRFDRPGSAGAQDPTAAGDTPPGATSGPAFGGPLPEDPKERTLAFWQAQRAGMDALKKDGGPAAAEPRFRRALALDPDHEDARYYLAAALVAQDRVGEALEHLRELARRNPQSQRAFKRWGTLEAMVARSPEELDEAAGALERALEINQEETGSLLVLAEIDLLRRDRDRARQHLEWATATNVRAAGGQFLLGYLEWKDGRPDAAGKRLEAARAALGPDWVPEGSVAEGDTETTMHTEESPLAHFWRTWDGEPDPDTAYAALDRFLTSFRG